MRKKTLKVDFNWEWWRSSNDDMGELQPLKAARILFDVLAINDFEHALLELKNDEAIWGPVHTSVGQEATAAATVAALHSSDKVVATYRAHHHFLSKALDYCIAEDWDPVQHPLPEEGAEVFKRTMAEVMGLAPGYCGGRGGSMHLRYPEAGFLGSNAIVAGGAPLAAGAAYAEKSVGSPNIVVCYIGDGAVNQGAFHEACNLAGVWQLPLIIFIENNLYAVATSVYEASAVSDLSLRASSYGMDGYIVDGNDAVAIYRLVEHVAGRLRDGGKPCLIEAKCYRRYHHAGDIPGSNYRYRTEEEERQWGKKEVVRVLPRALARAGVLSASAVEHIRELARTTVTAAVAYCTEGSHPRRVRSELWPKPESTREGIRSRGAELAGIRSQEIEAFGSLEDVRYSDAIAAVTGRWLEKDPQTLVFGEEVANLGGGAYGATKGLAEKHPGRVVNTPISEGGFSGLGLGAAMLGMKPIIEIMFADFALVAADQLFNQISKARHMYGNTTDLPLVIRTRIGTGLGYGAQHSMDPVGLYAMFPGFRIVAPANAFDYVGLFNTAMTSLDPVVILEHNALYARRSPLPTGNLDYYLPFGKARVAWKGTDVTVLAYASLVARCGEMRQQFQAAGISVELIDLRSLDYASIDYKTIGDSVRKTGAVAIVEEAAANQGIGARLAEQITTHFFDELDGPAACVASQDISTPVSRVLELAALVSDEQILDTIVRVAKRQ